MKTQSDSASHASGATAERALKRLLVVVAVAALLPASCTKSDQKAEAPAATEKKGEAAPRIKHGTSGEVIVTLDAATQKVMGLQTGELQAAKLSPEIKAYGRVLDVTPLVALVAELTTARTAAEASQAELNRLKTLSAQNNASERALQSAQATAANNAAQAESARLRLLTTWGRAIAERNDLAAFVQSVGSLKGVLVQLDLPAGQAPDAEPAGARVFSLGDETKSMQGRFLGAAAAVDPQMQGRGFLFLVESNSLGLAANATLTGFITLPGEPRVGVHVPRAALVRFNGAAWAYVQTGEDTFQRAQVPLDYPLSEGWFVSGGLKPQDKLVIVGAQQLLSEEFKSQGGEEE
jgi:hypothetical protein